MRTLRLIFRLASGIAGRNRAGWIEAMAAEAQHSESPRNWALGCLWASIKDRIVREWRFLLAIVAFPMGAYLLSLAFFFPLSWLWLQHWIPAWVLVGSGLFSPLPFAFMLGRMRPGAAGYVAASVSFAIFVFFPLTIFWMKFGKSPFSWFDGNSTWFEMSPVVGLGCALLVWLAGVWLGSNWHRQSA